MPPSPDEAAAFGPESLGVASHRLPPSTVHRAGDPRHRPDARSPHLRGARRSVQPSHGLRGSQLLLQQGGLEPQLVHARRLLRPGLPQGRGGHRGRVPANTRSGVRAAGCLPAAPASASLTLRVARQTARAGNSCLTRRKAPVWSSRRAPLSKLVCSDRCACACRERKGSSVCWRLGESNTHGCVIARLGPCPQMSCLAKRWWSCTRKSSRTSDAAMPSRCAPPPLPRSHARHRGARRSDALSCKQKVLCAYYFPLCENDVKEHSRICRSPTRVCAHAPAYRYAHIIRVNILCLLRQAHCVEQTCNKNVIRLLLLMIIRVCAHAPPYQCLRRCLVLLAQFLGARSWLI